ncbi:tripartite tricarboxylate transporter substrate binding protein [Pseudoroseomonas wenyumeiae]|uniref:Tripartite tricarboxylate transporter substrate binding protein n=1 Tax=Teichococcus wenyumeiae TaxID=2478470 RepID=A0A3A9JHT0_9PROT|nr:tripartite tricarboxylate transporter substrate binding protein [Pseudoroseomonas wenyumeiae]RMI15572.1 tripartite tricarboxylate transporter substrate binding protein [Pseudoroseomonas wenyumeiae]
MLRGGTAALATVALHRGASAASPSAGRWPTRPITIIVPYSPGGGTDIFARAIAEGMRKTLGQPIVVENRAGANGVIGAEMVARAAPDGYTLAVCTGAHVINRYSMRSIPFHPVQDFTPVSLLSGFPLVIAINDKLPYRSIAALIEAAKAKPGTISFGTTETATSYVGNSFAHRAGISLVEVPYRGSGPQLNDLLAGHIAMAVSSTVAILPFNGNGAHILAVTSRERSTLLPDVPTLDQAGVKDYEFTGSYGMYAPKGTLPSITEKLYAAVQDALKDTETRKRLTDLGADMRTLGPREFAAFLQEDDQRWAQAAKDGLVSVSN